MSELEVFREGGLEGKIMIWNPSELTGIRVILWAFHLDEANSFHPGMKHTTGSSGEQGESGEHGSAAGPAAVLD